MGNMEQSTYGQLLVLGNGFDLSAGLKSSYGDYFGVSGNIIDDEHRSRTVWNVIFEHW